MIEPQPDAQADDWWPWYERAKLRIAKAIHQAVEAEGVKYPHPEQCFVCGYYEPLKGDGVQWCGRCADMVGCFIGFMVPTIMPMPAVIDG